MEAHSHGLVPLNMVRQFKAGIFLAPATTANGKIAVGVRPVGMAMLAIIITKRKGFQFHRIAAIIRPANMLKSINTSLPQCGQITK